MYHVEEKVCTGKIQVVANIQKQDSTMSDSAHKEVTECYVGHVTHIRNVPPQFPEQQSELPIKSEDKNPKKDSSAVKKRRKRKMGTQDVPPTTVDTSSKASSVCGRISKLGTTGCSREKFNLP